MDDDATYSYLTAPPDPRADVRRVFAIGKFDGVHLAHRDILRRAVRRAQDMGGRSCMFTFTPHPRFALSGDPAYADWLAPPRERARLARLNGIDEVYVAEFDQAFREQSAQEFFNSYLLALGALHLVVGFDFRLGRRGAYGTDDLTAIASACGVTVEVVREIDVGGAAVSSSRIRARLAEGRLDSVQEMMGRPYLLRGSVVPGRRMGREIGFPTANLLLEEPFVIPRQGVYVVDAGFGGVWRRGVANIGRRPTVSEDGALTVETHVLDFRGDLYGKTMELRFLRYLRPERRFDSLEALRAQLHRDVSAAREFREGDRVEANPGQLYS